MQSQKGGFRIAKQVKTKEQVEYEDATKNIKVLTAKLRLSQQGVDTSPISRQELDRIMALYDKMDTIAADVRNKTSEIQRDSNTDIQRINQKANEKYSQVSKDIDIIINKMKKDEKVADYVKAEQVETGMEGGMEGIKEEIKEEIMPDISPEKIREDIINSFTDRIMQKVRKEVVNVLEDYMNMNYMNMKAASPTVAPQIVIGQGIINKEAAKEIAINVGQCMVEESKNIGSTDSPDNKDIPEITPEMIEKTEDEISKKKTEETYEGEIKD